MIGHLLGAVVDRASDGDAPIMRRAHRQVIEPGRGGREETQIRQGVEMMCVEPYSLRPHQ